MKTIILFFALLIAKCAVAQNGLPHSPDPPPVNPGYTFTRSMMIDCADEIIHDIATGSLLGKEQQLTDYISRNYIGYIILCGLENSNIFGNSLYEGCLRDLIGRLKTAVPYLQIGIGGSDGSFFQQTSFLKVADYFDRKCFPSGHFKNMEALERFINDDAGGSQRKRSELCKFFIRVASFNDRETLLASGSGCQKAFDALYLQYRYWNFTSSMSVMQNEFRNFKNILGVMRSLKCNYSCIDNVDAEMLPSEQFNLQGWRAIDQITDADPIIDRMMVPAFTGDRHQIFPMLCKTFHFLSDRFSRNGTRIFVSFSAESSAFTYCNSSLTPQNYFGDYLNGTTLPSGNMYSVERSFVDDWNNQSMMCAACGCNVYADNHYNSSHLQSNALAGSVWLPYSMLQDNFLFKDKDSAAKSLRDESLVKRVERIDLQGRLIAEGKELPRLYFQKSYFSDGKISVTKIAVENR